MESNMAKFKHNKLKNTGMLFEFLLRQVTVDVLNKEKNSVALQIIKKRFNEHIFSYLKYYDSVVS